MDNHCIKPNKEAIQYLESCQKELDIFFNIHIDLPDICLLNSRKELDEIIGWKTENWLTAFAKNNKIYILSPEIYTKESNHTNIDHFWKTLKHEYSHIYFRTITKIGYPKWLNEGLSCFLARQDKKRPTKEDALKVFDYFQKNDWQTGIIGYFWVKFLIDKFGKEKILDLIKSINSEITEKQFAQNFYNIYGFHYSVKDFKKKL